MRCFNTSMQHLPICNFVELILSGGADQNRLWGLRNNRGLRLLPHPTPHPNQGDSDQIAL